MAHFAEINKNNIVTRVLVVHDDYETDGQNFLCNVLGFGGTWIQTSYNGKIRKNFAGIGFEYDINRDAFIPPKPFDSWLLDEETCQWISPIEMPIDDKIYSWDESLGNWVEA